MHVKIKHASFFPDMTCNTKSGLKYHRVNPDLHATSRQLSSIGVHGTRSNTKVTGLSMIYGING